MAVDVLGVLGMGVVGGLDHPIGLLQLLAWGHVLIV